MPGDLAGVHPKMGVPCADSVASLRTVHALFHFFLVHFLQLT